MSAHTPGPWSLEFLDRPGTWGLRIVAGARVILQQDAIAFSTRQKTRRDNELAVGFHGSERDAVIKALAEQNANGQLMAASPDLLAAAKLALPILDEYCAELLLSYCLLDENGNARRETLNPDEAESVEGIEVAANALRAAIARAEGQGSGI